MASNRKSEGEPLIFGRIFKHAGRENSFEVEKGGRKTLNF